MPIVDYTKDEYHQKRRNELIEDAILRQAWSEIASFLYWPNIPKGSRILEFGGGLGNNLIASAKTMHVVNVEPGPQARQISIADGVQALASLDEVGDQLFDLILFRHVLEHVEEPQSILKSAAKYLAASGKIVIVEPIENSRAMPTHNDLDYHLYNWNPRNLHNFIRSSGYEVESIRIESFTGRRKLLPIWRIFGPAAYLRCMKIMGKTLGCAEIVATARFATQSS